MKRVLQSEWIHYLLVFVFFLLILFWMPISGDDWNNYLVGSKGLHHMIGQAIGMYFDWEGRFVSRLLINFLTYYKFLFNFITAGLLVLGIYLMVHFRKSSYRSCLFLFAFGTILFLDNPLFTQSILWVAGSITYLFPSILILWYFYYYYHHFREKMSFSKWQFVLFGCFSFCIPMFVENLAFAFVFLNFLLLIYEKIFYHRWNRFLIFNFVLSLFGAMLMFFSPGSAKRIVVEGAQDIGIFTQFWQNIPFFVAYTFSNNIFLVFLMIVSAVAISCSVFAKRNVRYLAISFFLLGPVLLFRNIFQLEFVFNSFWVLFFVFYLLLIFSYYRNQHDILFLLSILFLIGLSSNMIMMFTPAISSRTSLFWVICASTGNLLILDDLVLPKMKKIVYDIGCGIILITCSFFLIAYYNLNLFSKFLDESIKKELKEEQPVISIYQSPSYLSWGLLPTGEYHTRTFKEYYGISLSQELVFKESVWKYFVFFDLEETKRLK